MKDFNYNEPNTRERIAARRRAHASAPGEAVVPGPRRRLASWLTSGKIISLPLLLFAIAGLVYVAVSDRFVISDVQVTGAVVLKPEVVAGLADAEGQSIWFVDTQQIAERLQSNPYIQHVELASALPNRLDILVRERRPEIRWQLGTNRYLLDASGLVLGVDTTLPLSNTLVIEDHSANRLLAPNDRIDPTVLEFAQTLALRLPSEIGLAPRAIGFDSTDGLSVTTPDNRTIIFGRDERLDDKLAVLNMLLGDGTPFTTLDLRPATPYYRNEGAAPPPTPEEEQP